jgi:hypothetical protein
MHKAPNGKIYVGQSRHPVSRWGDGGGYYQNEEFTRDIEIYGWNAIEHYILKACQTLEEALLYEALFIVHFDSEENGYNFTQYKKNVIEGDSNRKPISDYQSILNSNYSDLELDLEDSQSKNIFVKNGIPISEAKHLINEWIYSDRDRNILIDRFLNGIDLAELANKYEMSLSQIKRVIASGQSDLEKHI